MVDPTQLQCRSMQLADLPAVLAVEQTSALTTWSEDNIHSCLAAHNDCLVLANQTHIVGYMIARRLDQEAELLQLCIDQTYSGRGYGSLLLQQLITLCQQSQIQKIFLEVAIDNISALALYHKFDFKQVGYRANYYRRGARSVAVDAQVMCLELF